MEISEIFPIPEIPKEIENAVSNKKLIIFIGAGVSRIIGCSGWKELSSQLVNDAYKKDLINFHEKKKLIDEYKPRKIITIFKRILPENLYKKTIKTSLKAKNELLSDYPIYDKLFKMRGTYITTNVDTYFDEKFESSRIFKSTAEFKQGNIKLLSLFHLHGSIKDFNSIIFTTQEYINHYNKGNVKNFLKIIFNSDFTVLFVGYSLSELEILDYVLLKGDLSLEKSRESEEIKHFILLPFFKAESNMFEYERKYFAGLNVSAIPYAIDEKGYNQLYYVIEDWEKKINISSPFLYNSYDFIEQNINQYIEANASKIFQLIRNDEHFRNHFFKNLKSIEWFYPIKEKGYFKPDINTQPQKATEEGYYSIPRWNVLPYLEKISQQIYKNEEYTDELLKIIKDVTQYHIDNNNILENYHTWWYFVKILLNIPNNEISLDIIELISIWLDSRFDNILPGSDIATKLLPKFLNSENPEDWEKVEKIIDIITGIKWIPLSEERAAVLGKKYEPKTTIDSYWLLKSFESNAKRIGEKCSENIVFLLADRLKEIFRREYKEQEVEDIELFNDYSYIWFRSISLGPGIDINEAKETLTSIIRDIILYKVKEDKEGGIRIFEKFLGKEYKYPIFLRFVIFAIGSKWENYKDFFWQIIEEKVDLIFNNHYFFPEVYELLENNIKKFSKDEKDRIIAIIEKGPQKYLHTENKDIASWKQKWYSALKQDPYFKALYDEQREITQEEKEISFKKPPVAWIELERSPLSKEEILEIQNEKLANYINFFKPKYRWKGPTTRGLSNVLRDAMKDKPEKFINDFDKFINIGYLYIDHMLWGIQEAWNNKKKIDWGKLFEFIKNYINRDSFWNDEFIVEGDDISVTHSWVTGIIGILIQDGTKDNSWAFSEDYFEIAKEILFLILEKEKIDEEEKISDFVTHALNSSFGKVLTALIYLALRIAEVQDKKGYKEEIKLDSKIKEKYEKVMQDEIVESYTLLGQYMPKLTYLDKNWVKEKINIISFSEKKILWEAFMDGYLFNRRVYENLYKLMKSHYEIAIDYDFKEEHTMERLIQHISVGYLHEYETLDSKDSLFYRILDKWDYSQIKEVINFFWMQKDYIVKIIEEVKSEITSDIIKMREKIINFWEWVYENKYKKIKIEEINNEDKKILSDLSLLVAFIDKIDSDNINCIKLSACYANIDYKSPFFIEYLEKLKDKDNKGYVGEILLEMLEYFTPDYNKKHIKSIVEYLYKAKFNEHANKISNIYGSRGNEFLRDLYNKYN